MRVLTIQPGPDWAVMDVHRGWVRALRQLGCQVQDVDYNRRLTFYQDAHLQQDDGTWRRAFPIINDVAVQAGKTIESALYEWWPDIVWATYGPLLDPNVLRLARSRGHIVVLCHTESPYEDDRQMRWAEWECADLHLINDPTNLDAWRELEPATWYLPHSYDPATHRPPSAKTRLERDVCFVGSGFPSRVEWLTRFCEAAGDMTLGLAGNWQDSADTKLAEHVLHPVEDCIDNPQVPPIYWTSRCGLNMYRRESQRPELETGWSMSPREIEMAACGLFYLTEPRGENRKVLPMLPTFESPEDAAEQARWWLANPARRLEAARQARAAVADWTFENRARQVLTLIGQLAASS